MNTNSRTLGISCRPSGVAGRLKTRLAVDGKGRTAGGCNVRRRVSCRTGHPITPHGRGVLCLTPTNGESRALYFEELAGNDSNCGRNRTAIWEPELKRLFEEQTARGTIASFVIQVSGPVRRCRWRSGARLCGALARGIHQRPTGSRNGDDGGGYI